jgi:hypothetical protein
MKETNEVSAFLRLTESLLSQDVTRGTMMGYPCLRFKGIFFVSEERGSGNLIVKLRATRVKEHIAAGNGVPFMPNGRVFKEWLLVTENDEEQWRKLLSEALAFAEQGDER